MVKVTDKYYIDADSHCYRLQEKVTIQDEESKIFGKEVFRDLGYYSSIENCLNGVLKLLTREYVSKETENSLKELLVEIKSLRQYLENLHLFDV